MASTKVNIQGHTLEVIVVCGTKLRNTAMVGKQDPFVELVYGGSKFRTNPCKVSGTNPSFHDKFMIGLIQGLYQVKISVHSRNSLTKDDFIGEGKVSLTEVLQKGCHDTICYLKNNSWCAGEIRLILMYPHAQAGLDNMNIRLVEKEEECIVNKMRDELTAKDAELMKLTTKLDACRKNALHEAEVACKRIAELEEEVTQITLVSELAFGELLLQIARKDDELSALKEECQMDPPPDKMVSELEEKDAELSTLRKEYDEYRRSSEVDNELAIGKQKELRIRLIHVMWEAINNLKRIRSNMAMTVEQKDLLKEMMKEIQRIAANSDAEMAFVISMIDEDSDELC